MKSIRLSLVVFFLALFGLAAGAISAFFYRTASRTLHAKEETTRQLVETQYEEKCDKERARLDQALLYQARTVARLAQFQVDWRQARATQAQWTWNMEWRRPSLRGRLSALGLLTPALAPQGHMLAALWAYEASPNSFPPPSRRAPVAEIKLDEDELLSHVEGQVAEYFQIDSAWGSRYLSRSLEKEELPFDAEVFQNAQVLNWEFDDYELKTGRQVRRVTLKAAMPGRMAAPPPPPPGESWGPRGGDGERRPDGQARGPGMGVEGPPRPDPALQGPPAPGREFPRDDRRDPEDRGGSRDMRRVRPALLVQCAADTEELAGTLDKFAEERDSELTRLSDESADALRSLRVGLMAVSLGSFLAVVVGTILLVDLGLSSLQRLSDAVSRVSERDFRLQIDEATLPSELKPVSSRLQHTLKELGHAFAREKQAVADISHELRTPVAALLTTIEVTLRKARSPEEYREVLEECRLSGQHMGQLVERLLVLARLDAGVDRLQVEDVDVAELAEQCAALVKPLASARGLSLRVEAKQPSVVRADPAKLREVITNLLHNGIEYNRENGSVDLSVGLAGGSLRIEVRDTGVGIAPSARAHLFERFFRADPSRHAEGVHAGLGLAIVKGYVDLMGGSIGVESTVGQGSTFRVLLPAA